MYTDIETQTHMYVYRFRDTHTCMYTDIETHIHMYV